LSVQELIRRIVHDISRKESKTLIAQKFHSSLAELFVHSAMMARSKTGIDLVALSGGVYQNRLFFRIMQHRLRAEGFKVVSHRLVPTNDGGLALGQVLIAAHIAGQT